MGTTWEVLERKCHVRRMVNRARTGGKYNCGREGRKVGWEQPMKGSECRAKKLGFNPIGSEI